MALNMKKMVSNVTSKALPAAGGGAVSLAINKLIPASINPKIRGVAKILLGAVIPEFSPKTKFLEPMGLGFAGQAGAELAAELVPSIAGPDDMEGIGKDQEYIIDQDFVSGPEYSEDVAGVYDPQVSGSYDDPQVGNFDED